MAQGRGAFQSPAKVDVRTTGRFGRDSDKAMSSDAR